MKQPIKDFLIAKETEAFKNDKDKYNDYPVQFTNNEGMLETGYIQDAQENVDGDLHELEVVILKKDNTAFRFVKTCKKPKDCPSIDWDIVHCAYSIRL